LLQRPPSWKSSSPAIGAAMGEVDAPPSRQNSWGRMGALHHGRHRGGPHPSLRQVRHAPTLCFGALTARHFQSPCRQSGEWPTSAATHSTNLHSLFLGPEDKFRATPNFMYSRLYAAHHHGQSASGPVFEAPPGIELPRRKGASCRVWPARLRCMKAALPDRWLIRTRPAARGNRDSRAWRGPIKISHGLVPGCRHIHAHNSFRAAPPR